MNKLEKQAIRDGFGLGLLEAGKENASVVALAADLAESIRMQDFAEKYPSRFFEVGVAEQNLIGVAAGLAKEGLIPFAGSFAAFSPGRNYDQIRVSVCYSGRNVKIVGGHAGLTVGPDGATHQMLEDIAMMRALPNMIVLCPSDLSSARALTLLAARIPTPVYIRLSRAKTVDRFATTKIEIGKAVCVQEGTDFTIAVTGVLVDRAMQLAQDARASHGWRARVLVFHTIKPLDTSALELAAKETGALITLEEHQAAGGFGSAVAEWSAQNFPLPLEIVGVQDTFGESGEADELLDAYGFSAPALLERVRHLMSRK